MIRLHSSPADTGSRIDRWLAEQLPELSRSRIQALIKDGDIRVNGRETKPHSKLCDNSEVTIEVPAPEPIELAPADIPLEILFEDSDLLVVNKPAGLVVHPAPGHASGTLVNALLYHCRDLAGIGGALRPGLVHRLDKDTSGALVVAKNDLAMQGLVAQFKSRSVSKEYVALVKGRLQPPEGTLETLLGRSRHDRQKMAVQQSSGKQAITHYRTVETYENSSLLRVRIETGRSHQIRVHMSYLGHPVLGDAKYGRHTELETEPAIARQMLHAERLMFHHPRSGKKIEITAPMPADMRQVIAALSRK